MIRSPGTFIWVSAASVWRIGIKAALGRLELRDHADPFDRMLIAQAQCEDLTLVTSKARIRDYDIRTIDAAR